jgi:hypothetical protein
VPSRACRSSVPAAGSRGESAAGISLQPLVYAFVLGFLIIGRQVSIRGPVFWVPVSVSLMVAAQMRFRIHVYRPIMPGFMLLMVYFSIRVAEVAFRHSHCGLPACFVTTQVRDALNCLPRFVV